MIRVAICDDSERTKNEISAWIRAEKPACEIQTFSTGEEFLEKKESFDIIFLDISMGKLNGIETARKIREYSKGLIIFVTACKEYVFDAFDVKAFHYLIKPLSKEKFLHVFQKAYEERLKVSNQKFYLAKIGTGYHKIPYSQILYGESSGRKIILHTKKENLEFYGKMDDMEKELGKGFYRCHRGYLVNLEEIEGYDTTSIFLKNGERIFLARQKYTEFVSIFMDYLKR